MRWKNGPRHALFPIGNFLNSPCFPPPISGIFKEVLILAHVWELVWISVGCFFLELHGWVWGRGFGGFGIGFIMFLLLLLPPWCSGLLFEVTCVCEARESLSFWHGDHPLSSSLALGGPFSYSSFIQEVVQSCWELLWLSIGRSGKLLLRPWSADQSLC